MTETRATPTPARGKEVKKPLPARISLFYRQVIAELRKVVWPTQRELITYTTVVLAFVGILMVIVTLLDFAFGHAVLVIFGGS